MHISDPYGLYRQQRKRQEIWRDVRMGVWWLVGLGAILVVILQWR